MKKISIIICFLMCASLISGQQRVITDSLHTSEHFNIKLQDVLSQGQFNEALILADSVAYYAKKENALLTLASSYEIKAEIYKFKNEPEKAIQCIQKTIPIYKKHGLNSNLVNLYSSLSSAYRPIGKLDSTYYVLKQAEKYVSDTTRVDALHFLYNQKSLYHENTARLDSAIYYVFKRIAITDSLNHYKLSNANIRLSSLFLKVSDFPKSLTYVNKALLEIDKSERPLEINELRALSIKSQLYFKLNKPEEALALADKIISTSEEKKRPDFEVFTKTMVSKYHFDNLENKSETYVLHDSIVSNKKLSNRVLFRFYLTQLDQYIELKNRDKSNEIYSKLEDLFSNIGALSLKQSYHELSSKYYEFNEDFQSSLIANNTYLEVSKHINERQKIYTLYDLETKYQTAKKDKTILENELKLEKSHAKSQLMTILIISLLLASTLLWFTFQQRQKRIQQQLLAIKKEQEVITLESLIEGEEKERLRIAQELHDGVNGNLSAIKYKLSTLLKMNNQVINEAVSMIDNSCQQVRAISHNLVPPSLKDFNLIEAVSSYCENMNSVHYADISFQHIGEATGLSKKVEVNIFRIIQELITNAIKHSEAKTIDIQISNLNDVLLVSVEDNGKGYKNKDENQIGIGLNNIKTRVNYLNANLEVITNDNGTSNTIEIDLNKINDN